MWVKYTKTKDLYEPEAATIHQIEIKLFKLHKFIVWKDYHRRKGDSKSKIETLNYKKMVEDINLIVQTDFMLDMECKQIPGAKPYSQEEAEEMANALGRIYAISHCDTCSACNKKYRL